MSLEGNDISINNKMVKDKNVSIVLKRIAEKQSISRMELSKEVGLTPPTVSTIISELMDKKLVKLVGVGESSGGRRPLLYEINKEIGYVIGIDIMKNNLKGAVFNLLGEIISEYKQKFDENDFINTLKEFIHNIIKDYQNKRIFGIGIAMSGNVSKKGEIVKYTNVFDEKNVPLKKILKLEFPFDIIIEERVRCATYAKNKKTSNYKQNDIVYIQIGPGIGAGILINGDIYYGYDGEAGELGHIIIKDDGPSCACGMRGCLEQLSSETAIVKDVIRALESGRKSIIKDMLNEDTSKVNGEIIVQAAQKGDILCLDVLDKACKYLAIGIINITMILNPNLIIIMNNISESDGLIKNLLLKNLENYSCKTFEWLSKIVFEKDFNIAVKGAALLVIEKIFDNPNEVLN